MPNWNGAPIPSPSQVKIPSSIPQNFNWNSYVADPKGTFNKFKGAREVHRVNWKGYKTATTNAKKIFASSPSKKFIGDAGRRVRQLKKTADATKKVADTGKKVQDAILKNVPGANDVAKGGKAGSLLGGLLVIGGVAALIAIKAKFEEFLQDRTNDYLDSLNNDITKTNQLTIQVGLKVKEIEKKINNFNKELDTNAKDYYRLNKQQESLGKDIVEAKKKANDVLYETREGRKIVTGLAEAARKLGNDALYEARQNKASIEAKISEQRISFDAKIQSINAQISKFNNSISEGFQKSVNATISKIQSDLAATRSQLNAIKPQTTDTNSITANAVAAARALVTPLQSQVGQLGNTVNGLQGQVGQIPVLADSVGSLAKSLNTVNNKADAAMNEARNKGVPNLAPIQQQLDDKFNRFLADNNKALGIVGLNQSNLAKEFDAKLADFNRQNSLTADQRFNEFRKDNDRALGIIGLNQSILSKEFDAKLKDFQRQSTLTADQRFEEFQQDNKRSLGLISGDLKQVTREVENNKITITKIDTKLGEQAKVNDLALPKLDQILGILPFIPARAADAIRPDIPTLPQIEAATGTAMCKSMNGGCSGRKIDDAVGNINGNTNNRAGDILNGLNLGANAALLQGQQTILARLGDQLPGGIGGKLSRFADWMQLDRVLNVMILGATIHNALMLSNDIGQTFVGIINNVLQLIGLKKEDGSTFDIGSVISSSIENLIKGAIGAENYTTLTTAWAKANRIYQASINILNAFQGLSSVILTGLEMTAGKVAKIGNALRDAGEVLESAYSWMNPQPKFNRVTQTLESLQNGASTIQMVTQAPLDIINATTELTTATTELTNAIKQDENPANKGKESPEPDKLKADQATAKLASASLELADIDLDPDD
ncbi:hypothetical protein [Nostoc sp.]|uniref:hypothetical protein n=1 Tax=Nostoc sp. TaxID=1180 RepID=UPI002FFBF035